MLRNGMGRLFKPVSEILSLTETISYSIIMPLTFDLITTSPRVRSLVWLTFLTFLAFLTFLTISPKSSQGNLKIIKERNEKWSSYHHVARHTHIRRHGVWGIAGLPSLDTRGKQGILRARKVFCKYLL